LIHFYKRLLDKLLDLRNCDKMGGNELEVLEHYNRKIKKYGEHKEAGEILLKCLYKLDQVRVNISLLQNTGIGRTVSALKKRYGDSEIGNKSRDLVNKWKDLVAKEEHEDEQNSDDNEEEDTGDDDSARQSNPSEHSTYIPTPIAPAYTPTPINELPTASEISTEDDSNSMHVVMKHEYVSHDSKIEETETEQHKSKKKKSHREKKSEERELSKSGESSKSEGEKSHRRDKDRSHHKHKHSDRDKESRHSEKESNGGGSSSSSKSRSKDHKSSKSSHKDKSRDADGVRKSDKHSDKDKHRTKDKESRHRVKEERIDNESLESGQFGSNSHISIKEEEQESSYDIQSVIKKEPHDNGYDVSKENSYRDKKYKEKEKRSKDKSKDDEREKKSRYKELATVDIFSKPTSDDESKSRKRSRDVDDDKYKSKRSKSDSSSKFVLPAPPTSMPPLPTGPSLIPEISPVYKPLPRLPVSSMDKVADDRNADEESLSILLSNKSKNRSAIYSGTKRKGFFGMVPSLYDQCIQVLKDHVDEIDEVGPLGYDILKPVLERASPNTLMHIEDCNPALMEETSELWEKFVRKDFRNKEREDMESWREMYERCTTERAEKLEALKGKVKQCYKAEEDQHKKTKLAYVDIAPKAPRNVRNAQAKHGTALPSGHSMVAGGARPRNQIGDPTANASRAGVVSKKPRVAPMMAKTMKLMRGIKGGFRR